MATLKLKKTPAARPGTGSAPAPSGRPPVRGRGANTRPTLAQAQAERARRDGERPRGAGPGGDEPQDRPPRDRRSGPPVDAHAPRTGDATRSTARSGPDGGPPGRPGTRRPPEPGRPGARDGGPDRRPPGAKPGPGRPEPRAEPRRDPRSGPNPNGPVARKRGPEPIVDPSTEGVRLSKRMSELGLASRREADEWIARGLVRVDGRVVSELGSRVHPQAQISVDPAATQEQSGRVTVLLHKPLGYVSGQAEDGHEPAVVLVRADTHWAGDHSGLRFSPAHLRQLAPAGRLDLDSSGLLVLTQDGRIARRLIGEASEVEKEYVVRVRWARPELSEGLTPMRGLPPELLERLRHGLVLDDVPLQPAKVSWQSEDQLRFVLREGRKRQIRRMCEAVGLMVVDLRRIRIGRLGLGDLPPGQWRYLGPFERF